MHAPVRSGNLQVSRCVLVILFAIAMGMVFVLEQPDKSILECHPRFQELVQTGIVRVVTLCLGNFGAPSKKPVRIDVCAYVATATPELAANALCLPPAAPDMHGQCC